MFEYFLVRQQSSVPVLGSLARHTQTQISPGTHHAQMASQLGLSRLTVYYSRFCDGRSASEAKLHPWTQIIGDTEVKP